MVRTSLTRRLSHRTRLAAHPVWQADAHLSAHWLRQNTGCISDLHRPTHPQGPRRQARLRDRSSLCLTTQSALERRTEKPRSTTEGNPAAGPRARLSVAADPHRRPHRRHVARRAPANVEAAAAHSGDDTRIAHILLTAEKAAITCATYAR